MSPRLSLDDDIKEEPVWYLDLDKSFKSEPEWDFSVEENEKFEAKPSPTMSDGTPNNALEFIDDDAFNVFKEENYHSNALFFSQPQQQESLNHVLEIRQLDVEDWQELNFNETGDCVSIRPILHIK